MRTIFKKRSAINFDPWKLRLWTAHFINSRFVCRPLNNRHCPKCPLPRNFSSGFLFYFAWASLAFICALPEKLLWHMTGQTLENCRPNADRHLAGLRCQFSLKIWRRRNTVNYSRVRTASEYFQVRISPNFSLHTLVNLEILVFYLRTAM